MRKHFHLIGHVYNVHLLYNIFLHFFYVVSKQVLCTQYVVRLLCDAKRGSDTTDKINPRESKSHTL